MKPIAQARAWDPAGPANGKGDDVLLVSPSGSGLAVVTLNHGGSSNFAIVSYENQGSDLLVNEIGRYAGQTTLPDRAVLLPITADDAWTITPS